MSDPAVKDPREPALTALAEGAGKIAGAFETLGAVVGNPNIDTRARFVTRCAGGGGYVYRASYPGFFALAAHLQRQQKGSRGTAWLTVGGSDEEYLHQGGKLVGGCTGERLLAQVFFQNTLALGLDLLVWAADNPAQWGNPAGAVQFAPRWSEQSFGVGWSASIAEPTAIKLQTIAEHWAMVFALMQSARKEEENT